MRPLVRRTGFQPVLLSLALQQYSWVFSGRRCRVSDEPRELTWLLGKPGGDTFLFAPTPPKEGFLWVLDQRYRKDRKDQVSV